MGSTMSFRGELDHGGNPICGETFMGGTICSMAPDHDGGHGTDCQVCGNDWMLGTCTCPFCQCCERRVPTPYKHMALANNEYDEDYDYCEACHDWGCSGPNKDGCALPDKYFDDDNQEPTDDDMAYVMKSLGIKPEEG